MLFNISSHIFSFFFFVLPGLKKTGGPTPKDIKTASGYMTCKHYLDRTAGQYRKNYFFQEKNHHPTVRRYRLKIEGNLAHGIYT